MHCPRLYHRAAAGERYRRTEPFAAFSSRRATESERLPEPIFTPVPRRKSGITTRTLTLRCIEVLERAFPGKGKSMRRLSAIGTLALYRLCADTRPRALSLRTRSLSSASTRRVRVVLADEMLTPDSSAQPLEGYAPGKSQPSFDKQFIARLAEGKSGQRLQASAGVIDKETIAKYKEALCDAHRGVRLKRSFRCYGVTEESGRTAGVSITFTQEISRATHDFYELRSNLTLDSTPLESFLWRKYFDACGSVTRRGAGTGPAWLCRTKRSLCSHTACAGGGSPRLF